MSKKETRRAIREAFPKAKSPPPKRDRYGGRQRSNSTRARSAMARPQARPASIKRAAIWGIVMAVLYFAMIQFAWKSGVNMLGNLIISVAAFIIFSLVIYAVDHFKYQRYLRKKGQL